MWVKGISVVFVLASLLSIAVLGQQSGRRQQSEAQSDVVRVTTNLVQADVLVTDKAGHPVTGLGPDDFEVFEDGKRQKITHFSFVESGPKTHTDETVTPQAKSGTVSSVLPARSRADVRRTIAIVVDDLGLSFESIGFVRQALQKFVNEQMQPGDVVAVLRTSSGVGSLEQFTSNKKQLSAAIERVRWYPNGRSGLSPARTLNEASAGADTRDTLQFIREAEDKRAEIYSVGTFGSLSLVVRGLGEMPGRKSLILMSEAFRLFTAEGRNNQLIQAMTRLTEQANAASVSIYTIDASGLQTDTIQASDKEGAPAYLISSEQFSQAGSGTGSAVATNPPPRTLARADTLSAQAERDSTDAFRRLQALMDRPRQDRSEAHTVLSYLAAETGGVFVRSRNDLGRALERVLADQSSYYLLGYRPDAPETSGFRKMHKILVKVKRPDLTLRARSGYFSLRSEEKSANAQTREEQLVSALLSPFASGDIAVRLTSIFGDDPAGSTYIRSLLHIDPRSLSFKESNGVKATNLDIVAVAIGYNGNIVDQLSYPQSVQASDELELKQLHKDGLFYVLNFPIKDAGSYQLRVAVRDSTSQRVGAAMQFVEVPDLRKGDLALSGIVLSGISPASNASLAVKTDAQLDQDSGAQPAVRKLRQGMLLDYSCNIYNARIDEQGSPRIQLQVQLLRDGEKVFAGKALSLDVSKQGNMKRLAVVGRLRLGPDLIPGEYVLQLNVTDLVSEKNRTGWMDFEIVD